MSKTLTILAAFGACALLGSAFVQERVKPKEAASVPKMLERAGAAFEAARYGACLAELREATALVATERGKALRAALPAAPAGLEIVPDKGADTQANNALAAAWMGGMGSIVTQEYRGEGRDVRVTVTADSPIVQMFGMWIANPAMLEKGSELVKYGTHNAVLKQPNAKRCELMILIDKTIVEVKSSGLSDEELLAFFDQRAVDTLAAALAN